MAGRSEESESERVSVELVAAAARAEGLGVVGRPLLQVAAATRASARSMAREI